MISSFLPSLIQFTHRRPNLAKHTRQDDMEQQTEAYYLIIKLLIILTAFKSRRLYAVNDRRKLENSPRNTFGIWTEFLHNSGETLLLLFLLSWILHFITTFSSFNRRFFGTLSCLLLPEVYRIFYLIVSICWETAFHIPAMLLICRMTVAIIQSRSKMKAWSCVF